MKRSTQRGLRRSDRRGERRRGGDQVTEVVGSTRREWSAGWEAADRPEK